MGSPGGFPGGLKIGLSSCSEGAHLNTLVPRSLKTTEFPGGDSDILAVMPSLALSDLIGAPVYDPSGTSPVGKVREVALLPQEDPNRISGFVVKTRQGERLLAINSVESVNGGVRADSMFADWAPYASGEGMLLLERDLLDQQIIDVYGRKVVRVNDVDIHEELGHDHIVLKLAAVDVGARGVVLRPAIADRNGRRARGGPTDRWTPRSWRRCYMWMSRWR